MPRAKVKGITSFKTEDVYLGIDPGKNGGLATICNGKVKTYEMPQTESEIWDLFDEWNHLRMDLTKAHIIVRFMAVIERVHAMPKQGVSSCFTFGMSYGCLRMALTAASISWQDVMPQTWMKGLSISPRKKAMTKAQWKDSLVEEARKRFPSLPDWNQTKGHQRKVADAILIAEYCRRINS